MSWYLPKLEGDIIARVQSDTGSGGLYNATPLVVGVYNTIAPFGDDAVQSPYVTFQLYSATQDDCMDVRQHEVFVYFNVYVDRSGNNGSDPIELGGKIMERIAGDWDAQVTGVPSYGFDRFKPGLSGTNWTATTMKHVDTQTSHEDDLYHWTMNFSVYCSKRKASS